MRSRADYIIPECYVDTNLAESLTNASCNHQKGCNQVAKVMETKFADRFAVGIIDADKRRPSYLKNFNEIAVSDHLKILRHRDRPHYIILVHPAADGFILSCAKLAGADMSQYNLPDNLKELTAQTKDMMTNKDERFKRLFHTLDSFGEMRLMKDVLTYLTDKRYGASDDEISQIFENK